MKKLPSATRLRGLFDYRDGELINKVNRGYKARAGEVAGYIDNEGYRVVKVNGGDWKAHRIVWKLMYGVDPKQIDHIDGDKTNNRLENLREVNTKENARNQAAPKNNSTGVVGVGWSHKQGKWNAKIRVDGKLIWLGSFSDFEDACTARWAAEKEHGFHVNHGRS